MARVAAHTGQEHGVGGVGHAPPADADVHLLLGRVGGLVAVGAVLLEGRRHLHLAVLHDVVAAEAVDGVVAQVGLVELLHVGQPGQPLDVAGAAAVRRHVGVAADDLGVAQVAADAALEVRAVVELEALVGDHGFSAGRGRSGSR